MDRDDLHPEVDEWVGDGIITDEQAAKILARYETDTSRRSRVVVALSLVGVALLLVGTTWFLATTWEDLPRVAQAAVLVGGPGAAYAAGAGAFSRDAPRIGHAFWVLGAILVGPSVFLFDDLLAIGFGTKVLLFVWTAVALPTGHALDSRAGTGVGLLVLVVLAVELAEPADTIPVVGFLGIILFALGQIRTGEAAWTYRVGGPAIAIGALLILTTLEGEFARFVLEPTGPLFAGLAGAVLGTAWLSYTGAHDESRWAAGLLVALGASVTVASLAPEPLPNLVAFAGTHIAAFGSLVVTGYLGYRTRSRALIDLAAFGGLLQILSFVAAAVVDAVSGSVALIAAGLILLAAGLALERGRRALLARF